MEKCGFGWQNRVLDAALTADVQAPLLPVANLKGQEGAPSLGWRVPGIVAGVTLSFTAMATFRAFSLHRTNLSASAVWQVRVLQGSRTVWQGTGGPVALQQALLVAPAPIGGDSVRIDIQDPANPDGWIDIPLLYAGPLWQPARNFSTESTQGRTLGQDVVTSLAGTEFVEPRWYQRKLSIAHQSLGDADVIMVDQILRVAATGQNILFLPDPSASPDQLAARALFGRLSANDITNPFGVADRHGTTLDFTERL